MIEPVFTHDGLDLLALHSLELQLRRLLEVDTVFLEKRSALLIVVCESGSCLNAY